MQQQTAASAGQFTIGGDITVNRLGFGAMRLTGKGIWGGPADREAAIRTLRRVPESASTSSTPPTATGRSSART